MSKTIDFRHGKGRWGHTIHGDTWTPLPSRTVGSFLRHRKIERVSVLVHSAVSPEKGDTVLYTAISGERAAVIAEVISLRDPPDMFRLVLEDRAAACR